MKKIFYLSVICLVSGFMLVSCSKGATIDDSEVENAVEMPENPTEDALSVTTDLETKTYGSFYSGFASRLVARIKNPIAQFNVETTKVCIVSDNAIRENLLSTQDYLDIYDCYQNGGVVIVTTPTGVGFNTKFQVEMALAAYSRRVVESGLLVNGQVPSPEDYESPFTRVPNLYDEATQEGIIYAAIAFNANNIHYIIDNEASQLMSAIIDGSGKELEDEIEVENPESTAYDDGQSADVLVSWINEKMLPKTKSNIDKEDIDSGLTFEYTHNLYVADAGKYSPMNLKRCKALATEKWKINAIHSFKENRDYYIVDQDMTFWTARIKPVPDIYNNFSWWMQSYQLDGRSGTIRYIKFFDSWTAEMQIINARTKEQAIIRNCHPQSSNSSTTESQSTTDGYSISVGGSIGFSSGGVLNLSYSESHSVTTGFSRNISDIRITNLSTDNKCAKWLYKANTPKTYKKDGQTCWLAGELLLSTMSQTNSALFYLNNPSPTDSAQLIIANEITYGMLTKEDKIGRYPNKIIVQKQILPPTLHSIQSWDFSFDLPNGYSEQFNTQEYAGIVKNIWDKMETEMKSIYPGGPVTYQILDSSDESYEKADLLLGKIAKQLGKIASQYGYKGEFTVHLKNEKQNRNLQQSVLVN